MAKQERFIKVLSVLICHQRHKQNRKQQASLPTCQPRRKLRELLQACHLRHRQRAFQMHRKLQACRMRRKRSLLCSRSNQRCLIMP